MAICRTVRGLRVERGLTQEELAAAAGVHFSTVNRVESDRHTASVDSLRKIAAALGVSLATLFEPHTQTVAQDGPRGER